MKKVVTLLAAAMIAGGMAAAPARAEIYINVAPPPPQVEVVPAPRLGYVWAPGYWAWRGHHHVWVEGHWVSARAGYRWEPDAWYNDHGRWLFTRGHWVRD